MLLDLENADYDDARLVGTSMTSILSSVTASAMSQSI